METVIQVSPLQTLRAGLRGTAHASGEEGYEEPGVEPGRPSESRAGGRG